MMTSNLQETIEIYESIPSRLGSQVVIGGDSYLDDQGRLEVRLAISDDAGERYIRRHEGDVFELAGATWRVAKVFGQSSSGRSRVATISKVE
jgi:Family of unknown function (DUF6406)